MDNPPDTQLAPADSSTGTSPVTSSPCAVTSRLSFRKKMRMRAKMLSKCVVCGERASGVYFGAVVCLPCKVRLLITSFVRVHVATKRSTKQAQAECRASRQDCLYSVNFRSYSMTFLQILYWSRKTNTVNDWHAWMTSQSHIYVIPTRTAPGMFE